MPFPFWLQSVIFPWLASTLSTFLLPIFSLTLYVWSSLSFVVSKISRHARFWNKTRQSGRWRLELLPQISRKDSAPMLFLPQCVSERPRMSPLIKMKWLDHTDISTHHDLVSYHISDYSHMVVPMFVYFRLLLCHHCVYLHLSQLEKPSFVTFMPFLWSIKPPIST